MDYNKSQDNTRHRTFMFMDYIPTPSHTHELTHKYPHTPTHTTPHKFTQVYRLSEPDSRSVRHYDYLRVIDV
jgi:hypothetical protein